MLTIITLKPGPSLYLHLLVEVLWLNQWHKCESKSVDQLMCLIPSLWSEIIIAVYLLYLIDSFTKVQHVISYFSISNFIHVSFCT